MAMQQTTQNDFQAKVSSLISPTCACFQAISKKYLLFHLGFFALVCLEIIVVGFFFSFLIDSFFFGVALALVFFTILLYFILRLYLNEQKPEELIQLRNEYLTSCKAFLAPGKEASFEHRALSGAALQLVENLRDSDFSFYELPKNLHFLEEPLSKVVNIYHTKDILKMKELLIIFAMQQQMKIIQIDPLSFEAHKNIAALALKLSFLYQSEKETHAKISPQAKNFIEKALVELKILQQINPQDISVHEMLASCWKRLKMKKEEIAEYEILCRLKASDPNLLFTLGSLYFEIGENAKGLKIYQELKKFNDALAHQLIQNYGKFLDVLCSLSPGDLPIAK